jgi:hypothetical protein
MASFLFLLDYYVYYFGFPLESERERERERERHEVFGPICIGLTTITPAVLALLLLQKVGNHQKKLLHVSFATCRPITVEYNKRIEPHTHFYYYFFISYQTPNEKAAALQRSIII